MYRTCLVHTPIPCSVIDEAYRDSIVSGDAVRNAAAHDNYREDDEAAADQATQAAVRLLATMEGI